MYLERALNMLHRPAALYEWPRLRHVSWNDAGRRAGEALGRTGEEPRISWVGIDEQLVVDFLNRSPDQHMMFETDIGHVLLSLLEPLPTHVRPTLVLTTVHVGQSDLAAELDHLRLRSMLLFQEGIEVAEENLQTSLHLVAASVEALNGLNKVFSENAEAIMDKIQQESENKG